MKIAIIGMGRLGKSIATAATEAGHQVSLAIHSQNSEELTIKALSGCDVAIECSVPSKAVEHLLLCAEAQIPTIAGTTAWIDQKPMVEDAFKAKNGAFLYASNFSIGMNITFMLNEKLAKVMSEHLGYTAAIKEVHHIHKLDAPSGTAISLAKGIFSKHATYDTWSLEKNNVSSNLHIDAQRESEVSGIHEVSYTSDIDQISIKHHAFNRKGFAEGALLAASWIIGKKGIFSMKDVLALD